MEIHLIRHTAPDINKGVCYGHTDVPLKDTFEEEYEAVLARSPENTTAVYSSPLSRCSRLAVKLANHFSAPLIFDDRLKELNFGKWENRRWEDMDQDYLQVWMNDYVNAECPNGESYQALSNRVNQFLEEVSKKSYPSVIVVCHGGVMKSIDAALNKTDLKSAMGKQFVYGGVYSYTV